MIKLSSRDNSIPDLEEEIDAFSQALRDKYPGLILDYHFDDRHGMLVISRIIVPKDKRNQGIGRDVMTNLMNFAKSKGLKTVLTPTPEYGSSKGRLNKFYSDFGFKKNKDMAISETMIASIKMSSRDVVKKFSDKFLSWFNGSKIVDSQGQPLEVYHGTDAKFKKFNLDNAAQNIIWFTTNRQGVESREVGAAGHGYIVHMYAKITNPADWEEYDKLTLDELEQKGYDGAVFRKENGQITGFVFYPEQLRVTKSIEIKGK